MEKQIVLAKNERSCYIVQMKRGNETKTIILATALQMASTLSLEAVTIGALAKRIQMSKSGLFAHFKSKENLQIEILKYAEAGFVEDVIRPAIKMKAGIPRIKKLVERWIKVAKKRANVMGQYQVDPDEVDAIAVKHASSRLQPSQMAMPPSGTSKVIG